jgi:DNA processing protein
VTRLPRLEIASPPIVLYRWGELRREDRHAVALVGTRRPSPYGLAVARDVATALAVHGVTVISGLARGIDSVAHRAALDAGGRTLAVLDPVGRDLSAEHRCWLKRSPGRGLS